MLHENTLDKIRNSRLKCVEYEIGMFLSFLNNPDEIDSVIRAASTRSDYKKILGIANNVNRESLFNILSYAGLSFIDVSFETQDDSIGPADIVIYTTDRHKEKKKIGVSVKYDNEVICNYTGRDILTDDKIDELKNHIPEFGRRYLEEMIERFGSFEEWRHRRFDTKQKITSKVTNEYIDLVRDAVIERWGMMSQEEKELFLYKVYRTDSLLDYWIYSFQKKGKFILCTNPPYLRKDEYSRVSVSKIAGQYIGFYIGNHLIGKTQIKFNNGIFESYSSKPYKDAIDSGNIELANQIVEQFVAQGKGVIIEGVPLKFGMPFSSWNFEISY